MEPPKNHSTLYNQRYQSTDHYWDFKPSSMAYKVLEIRPPMNQKLKLLEIGSGEGATALFFARNGYDVTAFDLSEVGLEKTEAAAKKINLNIKLFKANINEYAPTENFDIIFSSGTLQYLTPERRRPFIESLQLKTNTDGLHCLHTFVKKPFIEKAPDAEDCEYLWSSGELLQYYPDWKTEEFFEEIKPCNSGGVSHRHVHNRLWSTRLN
ncbi:MAG: methyltransferase domain-containing protein [Bdellovibrionaceae bacterium]|nr:methyltransferase domain-containing protein [Bdellovibrio sp.]